MHYITADGVIHRHQRTKHHIREKCTDEEAMLAKSIDRCYSGICRCHSRRTNIETLFTNLELRMSEKEETCLSNDIHNQSSQEVWLSTHIEHDNE